MLHHHALLEREDGSWSCVDFMGNVIGYVAKTIDDAISALQDLMNSGMMPALPVIIEPADGLKPRYVVSPVACIELRKLEAYPPSTTMEALRKELLNYMTQAELDEVLTRCI